MKHFNTIVAGNGLVGSAAARYLSEWGEQITIIGPSEPGDHSQHSGVFSSHYDQGRLTRKYSQDPVWAPVSSRAVDNYTILEEKSGIQFHGAVGRVHANRYASSEKTHDATDLLAWMADVDPSGNQLSYSPPDDKTWKDQFPFLNFPEDYGLFYEAAPAGYVNPREMLRAQNVIAQRHGAEIIDDYIINVNSTADKATITTAGGLTLSGEKVLIACGAFTNFNNLLPEPLPLRLKTESMIWAEVSPETAVRLQSMPGVGYDIEDPDIDDIYIAPPLLYPDGTYKIKMGCNTAHELWPTTLAEVQAWFQSGASDLDLPPMERALRSILPDVEFLNIISHRCIVTYTPSGYPMIDRVPSDDYGRLFVATGGNGSGAGGSDTLGHLAAGLMHDGRWLEGMLREPFLATTEWGENQKSLTKAQTRALTRNE